MPVQSTSRSTWTHRLRAGVEKLRTELRLVETAIAVGLWIGGMTAADMIIAGVLLLLSLIVGFPATLSASIACLNSVPRPQHFAADQEPHLCKISGLFALENQFGSRSALCRRSFSSCAPDVSPSACPCNGSAEKLPKVPGSRFREAR